MIQAAGGSGGTWAPTPYWYPTTVGTSTGITSITYTTTEEKSMFEVHRPVSAQDGIRCTKLTEENLRDVAAHMVQEMGGDQVQVLVDDDDGIITLQGDVRFDVGDWVVEGYDYEEEAVTFWVATLDERKSYDLR